MLEKETLLAAIAGNLIVSVQPDAYHPESDPMNDPNVIAAMAASVVQGGAAAVRINSPQHIRAVRERVSVPVIGLFKFDIEGYDVRITPTIHHAKQIAEAGADVIALDATHRPRPEGLDAVQFIQRVKAETGCLIMADISTVEEGIAAAEAGADFIATTLSGYTAYSPQSEGPDYALVKALAAEIQTPIVAEGRISTPAEARQMLESGAFAVTVGSAITRPRSITQHFLQQIKEA
ncbi:MAG: N-acetylmannosamine-6-phosphate 2-epimerase [Anaerolineae bacterium]|jgi:N-acylglucosamine-6-phosphate 2-epimerase|nr:N-acetylmannosamine-6-phosphate 2-epimerase [Anaerolineae bacterium]